MKIVLLACALALALAGCKKRAQPTLPLIADSSPIGGGKTELPEATLFHSVYRYPGHANQVHAFYAPEMEKRGARRDGDTWVDDNLQHQGDFGSNGFATARDPGRPGVWLAVLEMPDETRIDVWESVPKAQ